MEMKFLEGVLDINTIDIDERKLIKSSFISRMHKLTSGIQRTEKEFRSVFCKKHYQNDSYRYLTGQLWNYIEIRWLLQFEADSYTLSSLYENYILYFLII